MKCPNCKYIDGGEWVEVKDEWVEVKDDWDDKDEWVEVKGDKGKFYKISNDVYMRRDNRRDDDKLKIFGCPNCNIIFMDRN